MWAHYADGLRGFCIGFDEEQLMNGTDDYFAEVRYLEAPPTVDSFVFAVAEDQYHYHREALWEIRNNVDQPAQREDYARAADDAYCLMKSIWQNAFAAKPLEWNYEKERRLLIQTTEPGRTPLLRSFPAGAVIELIVGERMEDSYRSRLVNVATEKYGTVAVRTARRSAESYRLVIG
jgi:hypothetical protein